MPSRLVLPLILGLGQSPTAPAGPHGHRAASAGRPGVLPGCRAGPVGAAQRALPGAGRAAGAHRPRPLAFRNFGEANETAHNREAWRGTATGAGHLVTEPMQKALTPRTSHDYAGFNTSIPDQLRMAQFECEFTKKWLPGRARMPPLITMQVPNDHGAGVRPAAGYPYRQSYMAGNDLALGRILHFRSCFAGSKRGVARCRSSLSLRNTAL